MTPDQSSLCELRGNFYDSITSPPNFLPQSRGEDIIDAFPINADHSIIVSRRGAHLLHISQQVFLWNIFVASPIVAAALAPDQPLLALGLAETTTLWDLRNGQVVQRLAHSFPAFDDGDLAFGPHGVLAITSLCEGVQLWDVKAGELRYTLVDEEQWYYEAPKSLAFSPDGTFLAIGHASGPDVWLWRVSDGQLQQMMETHPLAHRIWGLAFSPDGTLLIGSEWSTDPEEESMPLWEIPTGKRVGKLPRMAWQPTISPDGQFVASLDEQFVSLWDLEKRSILWQQSYETFPDKMVFEPDGSSLVLIGQEIVRWVNVRNGQEVYHLFPPDVQRILSLGE